MRALNCILVTESVLLHYMHSETGMVMVYVESVAEVVRLYYRNYREADIVL